MNLPGNAFVALAAAAAWGGGDFAGGMGVKAAGATTRGALRVIAFAHFTSLIVRLLILLSLHARVPQGAGVYWGLGGGVAAALGLIAFYTALARGAMGAAAAVSGLLAAAIPVAFSIALQGAPGWMKAVGFALAFAAIWMIAAEPAAARSGSSTMGLAVFGGTAFGVYFVALQRANVLGILEPMALCRIGSLTTCVVLLLVMGRGGSGVSFSKRAIGWALWIALLDTAGNLLFLAATRMGRLDVAAVLASLYPASTILLAAWRLQERPAQRQVAGMLLALVAVVMITL